MATWPFLILSLVGYCYWINTPCAWRIDNAIHWIHRERIVSNDAALDWTFAWLRQEQYFILKNINYVIYATKWINYTQKVIVFCHRLDVFQSVSHIPKVHDLHQKNQYFLRKNSYFWAVFGLIVENQMQNKNIMLLCVLRNINIKKGKLSLMKNSILPPKTRKKTNFGPWGHAKGHKLCEILRNFTFFWYFISLNTLTHRIKPERARSEVVDFFPTSLYLGQIIWVHWFFKFKIEKKV